MYRYGAKDSRLAGCVSSEEVVGILNVNFCLCRSLGFQDGLFRFAFVQKWCGAGQI